MYRADIHFFVVKRTVASPGHGKDPTVVVVDGRPGMPHKRAVVFAGGDHGVERQQKLGDAPVVRVFGSISACADGHAVAGWAYKKFRRGIGCQVGYARYG